ncbi:MAG: MATE family efflux transporter [Clostridia bacterium]|nr:MATE family efflux transporter [Clostridia bacterium]
MKLKSNLIGTKDFYRRVFAIVVPMIIQNTITNVVSLLDNVMVGRVGTLQMSAVTIVNQLMFIFYLCIFGGMAGAGIFSTQYAGANDNNGIRHCMRMKAIVGVLMTAIALGVFVLFKEPLIQTYIAKDTLPEDAAATIKYAVDYINIMLIGLLPFAIMQVYASTLREVGETKLPMIASISAIMVNLVFNYLLIFGKFGFPRLEVAGAAIATVLSRFVEAAIIIIATTLKHQKYPFIIGAFKSLYIPWNLAKQIITKGMPLLVNEFLWSSSMAVLLQCYSVRGINVLAAVNISNTVNNLFNVVFLTMGNAVAIIVGQHLGANRIKEAKQSVWQLLTLSVGCCLVMGGVMACLAPIIPHIYKTEPVVKQMATHFLLVVAALMPVFAFAHNCYFTLRSGGRTLITFLFDSAFSWVIVVPLAFVLSKYTTLPILSLFLIVQSLDIIKCVIGFFMVKNGMWIRNIINES